MAEDNNPLFGPQREKSGSETFDKYTYQYHWALYKVITEHESRKEYAVFVELHEDVVISTSLEATEAKFELNQAKTTARNFSSNELTKLRKNVKGTSVLSKLVSNSNGKPYADKINILNLVSVSPFTLELKEEGVKLEKITLDDLSDTQLEILKAAIKNEIGEDAELPENLQFVISDLSEKKHQNDVIASISKLITNLYPGSHYNSVDIYRLLMDDLKAKGVVECDFVKWNELLKKKALTSITITKVINEYTNIKNEQAVINVFNQIIAELNLNVIQSANLRRSFNRYRLGRLSNTSSLQIDTSKEIVSRINTLMSSGEDNIKSVIDNVKDNIAPKIRAQFNDEDDIKGAIICEFILIDNE